LYSVFIDAIAVSFRPSHLHSDCSSTRGTPETASSDRPVARTDEDELKRSTEPDAAERCSKVGNVLGAQAEGFIHVLLRHALWQGRGTNEPKVES
jgi:hypothetical protein